MVRFDDLRKMIHQGDDHSVTAWGAVDLPQFRGLWAASIATLLVSCLNNGNPLPEKTSDRFHNFCHLLRGGIAGGVDPFGHGLDKVGIAIAKTRGILL